MQSNFNPSNVMNMNNQFSMTTDEQLLEQLRHMSAYGTHNQTTLMLLHEFHMRASRSFSKTFVPSKEVQDDSFLYTSIFKDGIMTHFFVAKEETKQKIDEIFEQTKPVGQGDGSTEFISRITLLMELGDVFRTVPVDEQGKQSGPIKRCGFASLFASKGFNEEPRHSSKVLPLAVIEVQSLALLNTDPNYIIANVLGQAANILTDADQLVQLDNYLSDQTAFKKYVTAVTGNMRLNDFGVGHDFITQIHLFPADGTVPLKFLGGLGDKWDTGFIKREQYPRLFRIEQMYLHPNGTVGGVNWGGQSGRGPWY